MPDSRSVVVGSLVSVQRVHVDWSHHCPEQTLTVKIVSGCFKESQSLTLEQAAVVGKTLYVRRNLKQDRANTGDPPDDERGKEEESGR